MWQSSFGFFPPGLEAWLKDIFVYKALYWIDFVKLKNIFIY